MKLNWAEMLVVNNPARVLQQQFEIEWMKKMMPIPAGGAVLEIGCGRGAGAEIIGREFSPGCLCAMDLDYLMIKRAYGYLKPEQRCKISFLTADALNLPHRDGTFDAVFGFGVLHHVPEWQSALAEIARVLKPEGTYFLEELYPSLYQNVITKHILLHPEENRFRSGDLKKEIDAAGFTVRSSLELKLIGILAVLEKRA